MPPVEETPTPRPASGRAVRNPPCHGGELLTVPATRWAGGTSTPVSEDVIEETPVAIVYNRIPHVVMMATPCDLEDFALGFSISEELVPSRHDLLDVRVERYSQGVELNVTVTESCEAVIAGRTRRLAGRTGCGICGADSIAAVVRPVHRVPEGGFVSPAAIARAFEALGDHQVLNRASGAVHAAGWATRDGSILLAREDVGRHNALDKLVGAVLRAEWDTAEGFVVVTSRASFEMVQKTTLLGAPLLAAISGPTGLAVRLATEAGLTLVGFARGDRLTVYSGPERITRE